MALELEIGMKGEAKTKITDENTAKKFGSGSVNVFGTPAMVALMEEAAINAVDKKLPDGFATVGIHLDISHSSPSPIGVEAKATARLVRIEGMKLIFDVEAYDNKEKIGEGTHERFIINLNSLTKKAEAKLN